MNDEELLALMVKVDPMTRRIPEGVRAIAQAIEAAERERWERACDAERAEFAERAANNDGSRQSDFAFGSVNSAERIKAAGLGA